MMANLESRIKTSAERELVARNLIRKELVEKAENGDIDGIKAMLTMIGDEAIKTNQRPRASVEVRNDLGQSLLSIATQQNNVELAHFLLTYWKTVNEDRVDFIASVDGKEDPNDLSVEAKVFKANPNSRDLKGWTCVCIAIFHNATKVLPLLLEHGGDPNIKSSYNKNAWDLAKDELDAAEKVVKSHAEIRQILIDYDRSSSSSGNGTSGNAVFGNGQVVKAPNMYEGLDEHGSPIVMHLEMMQEGIEAGMHNKSSSNNNNHTGGKKSTGGGGKSGGGNKTSGGGGGKAGGKVSTTGGGKKNTK